MVKFGFMKIQEDMIMKCEHCGKNEITFIYRSNVNGNVTEKHLCSECAEKLGVTARLAKHSQRMMNGFDSFFGRSLFDDFFTPVPSLLGRMERMLESPFEDIFASMPALRSGETAKEEPKQEAEQPAEESTPSEEPAESEASDESV